MKLESDMPNSEVLTLGALFVCAIGMVVALVAFDAWRTGFALFGCVAALAMWIGIGGPRIRWRK